MARKPSLAASPAPIRVGIGGWTFAPWRTGNFYPSGLPRSQELHFASHALTSIEVNATFYGNQTPETFARWRDETPDGFVFTVKAARGASQRKDLNEAAVAITRFFDSGVMELGPKLGPILWHLLPTRAFSADTLQRFLDLLPDSHGGVRLQHAIEAEHRSFDTAEAATMLRGRNIARVLVETPNRQPPGDLTGGFVYARLKANTMEAPEGYDSAALDIWAGRFRNWAAGQTDSASLALATPPAKPLPRPVFAFFISSHKPCAPAAAQALIGRLT